MEANIIDVKPPTDIVMQYFVAFILCLQSFSNISPATARKIKLAQSHLYSYVFYNLDQKSLFWFHLVSLLRSVLFLFHTYRFAVRFFAAPFSLIFLNLNSCFCFLLCLFRVCCCSISFLPASPLFVCSLLFWTLYINLIFSQIALNL